MKLNARHAAIVAILLALSIGFGFAFDAVATAIERARNPRPDEFAELIEQNASAYGVPEAVLWAVARVESGFASNARGTDGSIGLMQLTPAEFDMIRTDILGEDTLDAGLLYDPATNLSAGAAYLSYLYQLYGSWRTAFAAYEAGCDAVNAWLKDSRYADGIGSLKKIPNAELERLVGRMDRALSLYTKLYY